MLTVQSRALMHYVGAFIDRWRVVILGDLGDAITTSPNGSFYSFVLHVVRYSRSCYIGRLG
jgi:hypothetical protein